MLAFGTGFVLKAGIDIFFGGLLAIGFNWKRFKTMDLVILMSNGASVLTACLNLWFKRSDCFTIRWRQFFVNCGAFYYQFCHAPVHKRYTFFTGCGIQKILHIFLQTNNRVIRMVFACFVRNVCTHIQYVCVFNQKIDAKRRC